MKTLINYKNIITLIAFSLSLSAVAEESHPELAQVVVVDDQRSDLTFIRKDGETVRSINATDDDGLLTLAAINLSLIQKKQDALSLEAKEATRAGLNGTAAANNLWLAKVAPMEVDRFPSLKPAIAAALEKYAAYTANQIRVLEAKLSTATVAEQSKILADLNLAKLENLYALERIHFLQGRDVITFRELSELLGSVLKEFAGTHKYSTRMDDGLAADRSLIQELYGDRPFKLFDKIANVVTPGKITEDRGYLDLRANVFANVGSAVELNSASSHRATIDELLKEEGSE